MPANSLAGVVTNNNNNKMEDKNMYQAQWYDAMVYGKTKKEIAENIASVTREKASSVYRRILSGKIIVREVL